MSEVFSSVRCYVAGKVSGLSDDYVVSKFQKASGFLRSNVSSDGRERVVMSPHVLLGNPGFPHGDYMHVCYAMIDVCDEVWFLPDWETSRGALMEMDYAIKNKKPVCFFSDTFLSEVIA